MTGLSWTSLLTLRVHLSVASYSSEVWYLRLTPALPGLGLVPNPDPVTSDILMVSRLVPDGNFFSTGQNGW
eukprot:6413950-Ditylum_brightwellii.AAC.2